MKIKRLVIFILILMLLSVLAYYYPLFFPFTETGKAIKDIENYQKEPAFVERVVDGDTIETNLGTIRLLGVNTPEKGKAYYQDAKDFLAREIEDMPVEILRDKEDIDRYSRKLRYVFSGERLINIEIIEKGYATTFMLDDLKYKDKFLDAENYARKNGNGIWKKSSDKCADCIKLSELNSEEEFFVIKNECDFSCELSGWLVKDDANHFFYLNDLQAFGEEKYESDGEIWNNAGDRLFMRDAEGDLVVFYEY